MLQSIDYDIRHYIYATFADAGLPPTTRQVSDHFNISIASVEKAFERLADAHHIALAPGSHCVWMAHPFSGLPTNYTATIGQKRFHGN